MCQCGVKISENLKRAHNKIRFNVLKPESSAAAASKKKESIYTTLGLVMLLDERLKIKQ